MLIFTPITLFLQLERKGVMNLNLSRLELEVDTVILMIGNSSIVPPKKFRNFLPRKQFTPVWVKFARKTIWLGRSDLRKRKIRGAQKQVVICKNSLFFRRSGNQKAFLHSRKDLLQLNLIPVLLAARESLRVTSSAYPLPKPFFLQNWMGNPTFQLTTGLKNQDNHHQVLIFTRRNRANILWKRKAIF